MMMLLIWKIIKKRSVRKKGFKGIIDSFSTRENLSKNITNDILVFNEREKKVLLRKGCRGCFIHSFIQPFPNSCLSLSLFFTSSLMCFTRRSFVGRDPSRHKISRVKDNGGVKMKIS
jgi:hypothetical protein